MEAKPIDLLSDLPDVLLHHIVSSLQVKDKLKLKGLSRRLNETLSITTIPSLCFFNEDPCSCTHVFDFTMSTIPLNRPHANSIINRISFSSSCVNEKHHELHEQWIIKSFESFHVDELYLDYDLPSIFKNLPKFQSLKVLRLNMYNSWASLKVRPEMKLASLETLHMKSIFTGDSLDDWISQSFPSLKHLSLQKIKIINWGAQNEEFIIRSSCLEDLKIHHFNCFKPVKIFTENLRTLNCYFGKKFCESHYTKFVLETCEPNLQSLTWVGSRLRLSLLYDEEMFQDLQVINFHRSLIMQESNSNVLSQLFKAVRFARELHVDTQALQHLMGMFKDSHGEAPISLTNLRHLEIHIRFDIQDEDYITFLERLSNLETLTLVNYGSGMSPYVKERPVRDRFKKAFRHHHKKRRVRRTTGLKKVKLITREFNYSIVILIGLLIKSCPNLEEMMFYYPLCYHKSMMKDGVKYLQRFERASPTPPSFSFRFLKN